MSPSLTRNVALHAMVVAGAAFVALPVFWMVYSSFKTATEIFRYPPWAPPEHWSFDNYISLFQRWPFGAWYMNSVCYAAAVTVLVLFFCSIAGFAFAKFRFPGKDWLFLLLIGSTFIPFQLLLIPLFILMSQLGWADSPLAMIVPWIAPAFGIFLMRQYVLAVPDEVLEAARLDGAGDFRTYVSIVLPLVKPGLTTLGILTFVGSWNAFIWPLMILRDDVAKTLPVGLAGMWSSTAGSSGIPYGETMAAGTLMSIPTILIFAFLQRYFIAGLTMGAVK